MIFSIVYVMSICLANYSAHLFGPSVTPVNAFLLIGLDFVIRDKLHERVGIIKMFGLITIAGVISYTINPATDMIAIASVSAFALASLTDSVVYQSLINRPWLIKSNSSNIASSTIDSLVFPIIAFGSLMPMIVIGQFSAKVFGGAIWAWLLRGIK